MFFIRISNDEIMLEATNKLFRLSCLESFEMDQKIELHQFLVSTKLIENSQDLIGYV